jgi:DNA modification methylase
VPLKTKKMKTQKVQIETIKLDPSNPRSITKEAFESLKQSIIDFPEMQSVKPLVVADGYALAGNMRLLAYKDLGYRELHVLDVSEWSQAKRDEFMIKDNTHYGTWDYDALANEWDTLPLTEWGVAVWDTEVEDVKGLTDEDEVPEAPQEPITKLGDVWILGEHRVMCGDSTSKEAVDILMDGEKADVTFTSPPYNAGKNIRGHFYKNDKDNKNQDDYTTFLNEFTKIALENSDYVFVYIQMLESNKISIIEYQHNFKHQMKDIIVWNKTQYPPHINKGTFGCKWEYIIGFANEGKSRSFPCNWQGKYPNVIETENNSGNKYADIHKAGFPTALPMWLIEKMDFANSVYDCFMGTGTTLIACEKLNRKCYGMELDPKYCDVIVKRWEDFTGKKAHLEENEFEVLTQAH